MLSEAIKRENQLLETKGGDTLAALQALIEQAETRDRNEANTRHQIIDFILHDYLSWPRNRISHEDYVNEGFTDYIQGNRMNVMPSRANARDSDQK